MMRVVLLTNAGCSPCDSAKQYLSKYIKSGNIEVLDIQQSDFAADLANKHGFNDVPKLLVLDSGGEPFAELPLAE